MMLFRLGTSRIYSMCLTYTYTYITLARSRVRGRMRDYRAGSFLHLKEIGVPGYKGSTYRFLCLLSRGPKCVKLFLLLMLYFTKLGNFDIEIPIILFN